MKQPIKDYKVVQVLTSARFIQEKLDYHAGLGWRLVSVTANEGYTMLYFEI